MPQAILLAGPNGAGKTTFARQLVPALHPDTLFLNADEIQRETGCHPVGAGRELLRRVETAAQTLRPFVVETTLSSRLYAPKIARWTQLGFETILHFIELPSADFAIQRVARRVSKGGHHIPDEDVRRRFVRGLKLARELYEPLVDRWYRWRSEENGVRLVRASI